HTLELPYLVGGTTATSSDTHRHKLTPIRLIIKLSLGFRPSSWISSKIKEEIFKEGLKWA
ncbi:Integrator complex subunit 2-like protein, partial [Bienertia sinuspersici]